MIAVCLIRDKPEYRREAFVRGLAHCGYKIVPRGTPHDKRDLFVIWNRYGANDSEATKWERNGGTVLVCENGYIGKDDQARQYYAIAVHGHNGSGWWPVSEQDRFTKLNIEVKAWRTAGSHVLVCGQRGIGSPQMASPVLWHEKAVKRLAAAGETHSIKVRLHPGNVKVQPIPLDDDLRDCWACVIWSSSSGVKALVAGIPVAYDAPHWVCEGAASRLGAELVCDDELRRVALHRMSHAQWSVDEIARGEPFARSIERIAEARW